MQPRGRGGAWACAGRPSAAAVATGEAKRLTAHQTLRWGRIGTATPLAARPPPSAGGEVSIGRDFSRRGGADGDSVATESNPSNVGPIAYSLPVAPRCRNVSVY